MTSLDFETENPWVENDLIVLSIINNASAYALQLIFNSPFLVLLNSIQDPEYI